MIAQLQASPELAQGLQALLASARAEQMGGASADEAEERIVAQLRAPGAAATHRWARQTGNGGRATVAAARSGGAPARKETEPA